MSLAEGCYQDAASINYYLENALLVGQVCIRLREVGSEPRERPAGLWQGPLEGICHSTEALPLEGTSLSFHIPVLVYRQHLCKGHAWGVNVYLYDTDTVGSRTSKTADCELPSNVRFLWTCDLLNDLECTQIPDQDDKGE